MRFLGRDASVISEARSGSVHALGLDGLVGTVVVVITAILHSLLRRCRRLDESRNHGAIRRQQDRLELQPNAVVGVLVDHRRQILDQQLQGGIVHHRLVISIIV